MATRLTSLSPPGPILHFLNSSIPPNLPRHSAHSLKSAAPVVEVTRERTTRLLPRASRRAKLRDIAPTTARRHRWLLTARGRMSRRARNHVAVLAARLRHRLRGQGRSSSEPRDGYSDRGRTHDARRRRTSGITFCCLAPKPRLRSPATRTVGARSSRPRAPRTRPNRTLEVHTISWMPATLDIHPLRFHVEPGMNLTLEFTLQEMLEQPERRLHVGPVRDLARPVPPVRHPALLPRIRPNRLPVHRHGRRGGPQRQRRPTASTR